MVTREERVAELGAMYYNIKACLDSVDPHACSAQQWNYLLCAS